MRQMLLGWHYMYYYANAYAMNQYLAGRGYIVLTVNYRSGIGYGRGFREAPGGRDAAQQNIRMLWLLGGILRCDPTLMPAGSGFGAVVTADF